MAELTGNLLVAQSGGPTAVINSSVAGVICEAGKHECIEEIYGGLNGVYGILREELVALVDPDLDRRLQVSGEDGAPGVVLVVGVNGAGKTTTVGKIARILVAEDRSVVLGAADTFRAAAVEQLATWGERVGVEVVRGEEGADPASVAFRAVQSGAERGVDTVLVDTAGRLQNKQGLMDELGKVVDHVVSRIIAIADPVAVTVASVIERDHMPVLAQLLGHPVPAARMVAPAMHQHQRRRVAIAPIDIIESQALRYEGLRCRSGV